MVYVNDFKVGDTVVLRDGTTGAVEKISEYEKGFILELSCFPGGWFCCYADGCQKNFEQTKYDIVEHIPNQGEEEPAQDEMSVRDQFAMAALNGLLVHGCNRRGNTPEELSEVSYTLADAMMKARKGKN